MEGGHGNINSTYLFSAVFLLFVTTFLLYWFPLEFAERFVC
jgi:hypothetical protein